MSQTAREIAQAFVAAGVQAEIHGNPDTACDGISSIEDTRPDTVIFVEKARDVAAAVHGRASIVVLQRQIAADVVPSQDRALIAVQDIRKALPVLLSLFNRRPVPPEGVHASAVVGKLAVIGKHVSIGAYAVIGERCEIGDGAVIEPHVSVGAGSVIGTGSYIFAGARIYDGVRIGDRCRIHCGAIIGSDGYGYVTTAQGHQKVPQIGGVRIEDDVEIGANVTIDRGAIGDTVVRRGTKIDNLVHLAHNVQIGDHTLIIAQSGIAGSTRIGNWNVLAAQSGVAGHIEVGDRVMIGARSGVTKPIKGGQMISGFPARPHGEEKRIKASMGRLPEMVADVHRLKAAILRLSRRLSAVERVSCSSR